LAKDYLVIIPVFNEKDMLRDVTISTIEHSAQWADILFINDGSTDGSAEIINQLQNEFPDIKAIHKIQNEGYGASLISGFHYGSYFGYKYWITMDCDNQHQPPDLVRFRDFDHQVDLVSGSRYHKDSQSAGIIPPKDRVEINRRITCLLNSRYNWNLTDSFCGFKRYKASAFENAPFQEKGYSSPLELWAYVYSQKLKVCEIAVDKIYVHEDRSFGETLDQKRKRFRYYLETWYKSHFRFSKNPIRRSPCFTG
jgi:dolichol-phosphate mannosyltransferase